MLESIKNALLEDMPEGDITTDNLIDDTEISKANFIAKDTGILSGIEIIRQVFDLIGGKFELKIKKKSGDKIKKGDIIASIEGSTKTILKGERVALNILQYMSGIATNTNKYVKEAKGGIKILDTRKTTPNMRIFAKKAVIDGGGGNHRFSLSDMVMIKDNHIKAVGSITKAVNQIKKHTNMLIEVEVENIEMFKEALNTPCDIIMLDNMKIDEMKECIKLNNQQKKIEISGNITLSKIKTIGNLGADYVSIGALTHSFKAFDISLKFL